MFNISPVEAFLLLGVMLALIGVMVALVAAARGAIRREVRSELRKRHLD